MLMLLVYYIASRERYYGGFIIFVGFLLSYG